jgi:phosphatidylserine decarboxylase
MDEHDGDPGRWPNPKVRSIQPGGGVVMRLELAWGELRRQLLRTFFPGYVRRMRQLRRGSAEQLDFDPIDSRDLKYFRNQTECHWSVSEDPFAWRERLPFARDGLAELLLLGGGTLALALALAAWWWPAAFPPLVVSALIVWFFRSPTRVCPSDRSLAVSPADGRVVEVLTVDDPDLGPAVRVGIFLSIFNVHINRSPWTGTVDRITYRPGKFLNALLPESARENESLQLLLTADAGAEAPDGVRLKVKQITGQFARRIVCRSKPGDRLERGELFGMIKLGSRTELVLAPADRWQVQVQVGDRLRAGASPIARVLEP